MTSRLKSLELHGYKTFASRSLFEFPSQVTAVVGPNGSGKSNIADSIRWVLGEQSYSLLRGRKTEDMIFSGSDQRPRAGMASASITFDNSDGWLPIDFAEVSVTRRAYRDGTNEYLLNGQRVRLKEISELLAQSGLAERTYTIIGQGLVDAALSLKPDERRRFFEEAAGIGLYRSRREEAINRLDSTRRNLERVYDILSELEPRLQSLEKQARRAMEYERIKADLRLLLREWYGYHWHQSQHEVAHAREILKAHESRYQQARERLDEVNRETTIVRAHLQENRTRLNEWHTQSSDLHRQREHINRDLAVMEERQRALLDIQQALRNDLARLEEEQKARQERLLTLNSEVQRLENEMREAQNQSQTALQALQSRQIERDRIESQLRDSRKVMVSLETRQVQLKAHQDELTSRSESLLSSQKSVGAALEKDTLALKEAQTQLENLMSQRNKLEEEVKKYTDDLEAQRQFSYDLEAQRKRALDERGKLEAEKSKLTTQLAVLEQADKSFSGLNQGARFILQASKQGKIPGNLKALSSQLDVPSEYELAVASALGEFLDGVWLESNANLEHVLELLAHGEKGRTVLIGSQSKSYETEKLNGDYDGVIGKAIDLIKFPEELRPSVDLLLGKVWLVKNREIAHTLVDHLPTSGRLVTLQGEVFWSTGIVIAGQDGRQGVIGRTRQQKELKAEIGRNESRLSEARKLIQELDQKINQSRTEEQQIAGLQRLATQRHNQAVQMVQQATLSVEQNRQKVEWGKNQSISLEAQLKRTTEEIQQGRTSIEEVQVKIQEQNGKIREFNRQINGLPLDELQAQLVYWNTNAAVASRAVQDANHRLVEHHQALKNGLTQLKELQARLESSIITLNELNVQQNVLHEDTNELNEAIDVLRQKIEPAEQELLATEVDFNRVQANQVSAQQAETLAERLMTQAQLELTRQRETVESLRRRIEDDFGLVAFEYSNENTGQTPLPLDGMVEQLPVVKEMPTEIEENISRQRAQLRRMGAVNVEAQNEYKEVRERFDFLTTQVEDLKKADADLRQVITELDDLMRREFRKTFDEVALEFRQMFTRLFGGGSARLVLVDEENINQAGIDIEAKLPGRREQGLSLLSGGERSLTAVALIFSLLKVSPTPFCVMDEVDAMLDEANVGRFRDLLLELSENTQFLVITHNRNTVQAADVIYGITMGRDSASQVISLKLDEVGEEMVR